MDTLDEKGCTPLFFALKHGFTESSRILLSKGMRREEDEGGERG